MFKPAISAALFGATVILACGQVVADDWVATKLRGGVFVYVNDAWAPLKRGDVVSDDRTVRTQPSGRVTFQRAAEVIDVAGNSQIQIIDKSGRRYTTVKQQYGTVEIEAEVQNVEHFAVQTLTLVAVVKGTQFRVKSSETTSEVSVTRGHVKVEDSTTHDSVTVAAGQEAIGGAGQQLHVEGRGELPIVVDRRGQPLVPQEASPTAPNRSPAATINTETRGENSGNGNSDGPGNSDGGNSGATATVVTPEATAMQVGTAAGTPTVTQTARATMVSAAAEGGSL